jgi:hypothetical protein
MFSILFLSFFSHAADSSIQQPADFNIFRYIKNKESLFAALDKHDEHDNNKTEYRIVLSFWMQKGFEKFNNAHGLSNKTEIEKYKTALYLAVLNSNRNNNLEKNQQMINFALQSVMAPSTRYMAALQEFARVDWNSFTSEEQQSHLIFWSKCANHANSYMLKINENIPVEELKGLKKFAKHYAAIESLYTLVQTQKDYKKMVSEIDKY